MQVRPWQREIVEAIYATDDGGNRFVRTALVTMPRKNGKSGLAAGLALAHLCGPEAEARGQCYSASASRDMASLIFNEMEAIILEVPELAARCNVQRFHKRIEVLEGDGKGSIYHAMSADAKKDMAPAVDYMEGLVISRGLRHGGHPILRWNARNAVVTRDPAGNRKLDKERCREKIDGLVALAMALGVARRVEDDTLPACLAEVA